MRFRCLRLPDSFKAAISENTSRSWLVTTARFEPMVIAINKRHSDVNTPAIIEKLPIYYLLAGTSALPFVLVKV